MTEKAIKGKEAEMQGRGGEAVRAELAGERGAKECGGGQLCKGHVIEESQVSR